MLIRPVQLRDLDELFELAGLSSGGITTLPVDRRLLHEKIERSLFAFSRDVLRPKGESYLFVLEEKEIVGCAGILSKTGGYEPICTFRVKRPRVLYPHSIHNGPSEVGSLFLRPDYRRGGLGRFLSLARLLFMSIHSDRFDERVAASYRGVIDGDSCPFWSGIGEPLTGIDFPTANHLRYVDERFAQTVLPEHALYIPLLPQTAKKAIGKVHPNTQPALHILKQEGFRPTKEIDIFDGGPYYEAPLKETGVFRRRKEATVAHIEKEAPKGQTRIVGSHSLHFRALLTPLAVTKAKATLSKEAAHLLQVERGEKISYITPRAHAVH